MGAAREHRKTLSVQREQDASSHHTLFAPFYATTKPNLRIVMEERYLQDSLQVPVYNQISVSVLVMGPLNY